MVPQPPTEPAPRSTRSAWPEVLGVVLGAVLAAGLLGGLYLLAPQVGSAVILTVGGGAMGFYVLGLLGQVISGDDEATTMWFGGFGGVAGAVLGSLVVTDRPGTLPQEAVFYGVATVAALGGWGGFVAARAWVRPTAPHGVDDSGPPAG